MEKVIIASQNLYKYKILWKREREAFTIKLHYNWILFDNRIYFFTFFSSIIQ